MSTSWDRNEAAVGNAIATGNLHDAERLADAALAHAGDLPESDTRKIRLIELKARIAHLDRRSADAVELYDNALASRAKELGASSPALAPTLLSVARVELDRKRPQASIAHLQRLLSIDEENGPVPDHLVGRAYGEMGAALAQLGESKDAVEEYRDAANILKVSGPVEDYYRFQRERVKLLRQLGLIAKADAIEDSFRPIEGNYLWHVLVPDPRRHFSEVRYVSRWRRDQMPLRVWVPRPPKDLFDDPDALVETVENAIRVWENTVEPGVPSFVFVTKKKESDIPIRWVSRFEDVFKLAEVQREFSPTGGDFDVRYLAVGTAALLRLGSPLEALATVIAHETGHALGLFGHSPSPIDAMYSTAHMVNLAPSKTDLETIRELYSLEPGAQVSCPRSIQNCAQSDRRH